MSIPCAQETRVEIRIRTQNYSIDNVPANRDERSPTTAILSAYPTKSPRAMSEANAILTAIKARFTEYDAEMRAMQREREADKAHIHMLQQRIQILEAQSEPAADAGLQSSHPIASTAATVACTSCPRKSHCCTLAKAFVGKVDGFTRMVSSFGEGLKSGVTHPKRLKRLARKVSRRQTSSKQAISNSF